MLLNMSYSPIFGAWAPFSSCDHFHKCYIRSCLKRRCHMEQSITNLLLLMYRAKYQKNVEAYHNRSSSMKLNIVPNCIRSESYMITFEIEEEKYVWIWDTSKFCFSYHFWVMGYVIANIFASLYWIQVSIVWKEIPVEIS